MGEKNSLGIYWASSALYFVETDKGKVIKSFSLSLKDELTSVDKNQEAVKANLLRVKVANLIKDQKVEANLVKLSLPIKDIIFRSFIIPWMQQKEVENVVQFEINKYIPFQVADLIFSFHSTPITINGIKRLKVVFVGIQKSILEKYRSLCKDLKPGITLGPIEPATISLMRALKEIGGLEGAKVNALIEQNYNRGIITIIENGIPLFVREFQLSLPAESGIKSDDASFITKFSNEVGVSLDYFSRQDIKLEVNKIIFLGDENSQTLSKALGDDLHLPVEKVEINSLFSGFDKDWGFVKALGAASDYVLPAVFDLNKQDRISEEDALLASQKIGIERNVNYRTVVITSIICIATVFSMYFMAKAPLITVKKNYEEIQRKSGKYHSLSYEELLGRIKELENKKSNIGKILIKSDMAEILEALSQSLPVRGVWLESINMNYVKSNDGQSSKIKIIISGFAYEENSKRQYNLVSQYLDSLKMNQTLLKFFAPEDIQHQNIHSTNLDKYYVTAFEITCE